MTRPGRALSVAVACLAGLVLASCSSFSERDGDAARVGDATLTFDQLDELVTPPPSDTATGVTQPPATGSTIRPAIAAWVLTEVLKADLATSDAEITDADRQAAEAQLAQQFAQQWQTSPQPVKDLLVERSAALAKWNETPADPADLEPFRPEYEEGIETSGVACVAQIVVETEADAEELLAELAGSAERFGELASDRSIDQATAANGGSLPCGTSEQFSAGADPAVVDAALRADVGVPAGPVETEQGGGWAVVLVRPWDDVVGEVAAAYAPERFAALVPRSDVYVNPRFGEFDAESALVEPLGRADEADTETS